MSKQLDHKSNKMHCHMLSHITSSPICERLGGLAGLPECRLPFLIWPLWRKLLTKVQKSNKLHVWPWQALRPFLPYLPGPLFVQYIYLQPIWDLNTWIMSPNFICFLFCSVLWVSNNFRFSATCQRKWTKPFSNKNYGLIKGVNFKAMWRWLLYYFVD